MSKSSRLPPALRGALACAIALFLSSCATMTESSSQVRLQQLKDAQFAFIDNHTSAAAPASWDQATFDSEVAKITTQFTDAEAAEFKVVPARKQYVQNCADLFQRDAALVRKNHFLSPGYAANRKKQLDQNYDLLLKPSP
jgi:hypothetical protein